MTSTRPCYVTKFSARKFAFREILFETDDLQRRAIAKESAFPQKKECKRKRDCCRTMRELSNVLCESLHAEKARAPNSNRFPTVATVNAVWRVRVVWSVAFGNQRRGSLYIQINMVVRYWYGCNYIPYWNFVVLADCFTHCSFTIFPFSFLYYSMPDVSARARSHAREHSLCTITSSFVTHLNISYYFRNNRRLSLLITAMREKVTLSNINQFGLSNCCTQWEQIVRIETFNLYSAK